MRRNAFSDATMFGVGITRNGRHVRLEEIYVTKELPLYISHFATCPNAKSFRKAT